MGQIVSSAAKPKRCNANQLSQVPTPAAGEHILVSSDNSMNAAGQGNFDCYIEGDGIKAAAALPLRTIADKVPTNGSKNSVSSGSVYKYINDVSEEEQGINLFDAEQIVQGKYVNQTTGNLSNRATAITTSAIPIIAGHYYYISGRSRNSNTGVRFLDANSSPLKPLNPSTGEENTSYNILKESGTAALNNGQTLAPEGATHIQFGLVWNDGNDYSSVMLLDLGTTYQQSPTIPDYEPYGNTYRIKEEALPASLLGRVSENEQEIEEIKTKPVEVKYMDFGGNLFDKLSPDNVEDTYINIVTGNEVSGNNWISSGFIHLETGVDYIMPCYTRLYGDTNAKKVAYYDENKTFIASAIGTISDDKLTFSLPSTAYYVRVVVLVTDLDTFMLVKGSTYPSEYRGYNWKPNNYFDLTGIVRDGNPLYGKKACYDGDSIARGGATTSPYGWSPIIAERNNGSFASLAVGGGTITAEIYTAGGDARHWICNGIETLYNNNENPDYIIFEGGTNDADLIGSILDESNLPEKFGTWTESNFAGPFDKTTFCGAVEYMFQKAQSLFPHTKFGFIIAQKMGRNDNSIRKNRKAYFDVIMKICRKWGIPYINLWEEGFLNPAIDSHYNPNLDNAGNIEAHSLYLDGQHLTLDGYNSVTSKIEAWMKTL